MHSAVCSALQGFCRSLKLGLHPIDDPAFLHPPKTLSVTVCRMLNAKVAGSWARVGCYKCPRLLHNQHLQSRSSRSHPLQPLQHPAPTATMSGRGKGGKGLGKGGAKRHRKVLRDNIQVRSDLLNGGRRFPRIHAASESHRVSPLSEADVPFADSVSLK